MSFYDALLKHILAWEPHAGLEQGAVVKHLIKTVGKGDLGLVTHALDQVGIRIHDPYVQ